jgi:hypothetical protein
MAYLGYWVGTGIIFIIFLLILILAHRATDPLHTVHSLERKAKAQCERDLEKARVRMKDKARAEAWVREQRREGETP